MIERLVDRLLASDVPLERTALEEAATGLLADEAPLAGGELAGQVADALVGLGPLEPLLRQPDVSDILVNGDGTVWVERDGFLRRSDVAFDSPEAVLAAIERSIAPLGLRIDRASPAVDARLPDGSRLHAVIPPAAVDGPTVAVRRFTRAVSDLEDLVRRRGIDEEGAALLEEQVRGARNILVSGGTGSGKTTLLNVLSASIPAGERVVTVEDAAELQLVGHVVRLEARPPNAEGAGQITLQTLVRHALRLRPDRIIVGEVRGPEALDMIEAMSTGHAGSMGTVHANGPEEALWRLETMALSGDRRVAETTVRRQLLDALDVVVHVERRRGRRTVASVMSVTRDAVTKVWPC